MKTIGHIIFFGSVLALTSCDASYSSEAGVIADGVCECVGDTLSNDVAKKCLHKVITESENYREFGEDIDAAQAFSMEVQEALKDNGAYFGFIHPEEEASGLPSVGIIATLISVIAAATVLRKQRA